MQNYPQIFFNFQDSTYLKRFYIKSVVVHFIFHDNEQCNGITPSTPVLLVISLCIWSSK